MNSKSIDFVAIMLVMGITATVFMPVYKKVLYMPGKNPQEKDANWRRASRGTLALIWGLLILMSIAFIAGN